MVMQRFFRSRRTDNNAYLHSSKFQFLHSNQLEIQSHVAENYYASVYERGDRIFFAFIEKYLVSNQGSLHKVQVNILQQVIFHFHFYGRVAQNICESNYRQCGNLCSEISNHEKAELKIEIAILDLIKIRVMT